MNSCGTCRHFHFDEEKLGEGNLEFLYRPQLPFEATAVGQQRAGIPIDQIPYFARIGVCLLPPQPESYLKLPIVNYFHRCASYEPASPLGLPHHISGRGNGQAAIQSASNRPKRSTVRGEGRIKLISALTDHHNYANGSCLNLEPIGNNQLARSAEVSDSTASDFLRKEFGGFTKYRANCHDLTWLIAALKLLNQEFSPLILFGAKPQGEESRDDDE